MTTTLYSNSSSVLVDEMALNCCKLDRLCEKYGRTQSYREKKALGTSLISTTTLETLKFGIKLGYYLRIFPWKWDSEENCFTARDSGKSFWFLRWKFVTVMNIMFNFCLFLAISSSFYFVEDIKTSEVMFGLAVNALLLAGTGYLCFLLACWKDVELMLNSMVFYSRKYAKIRGAGKECKDGLETFCFLFVTSLCVLFVTISPATMLTFYVRMKILFVLNILVGIVPLPLLYAGIGISGLYTAVMNVVAIFTIVYVCIVFCNFLSIWFQENYWNGSKLDVGDDVRTLFKAHRILHQYAYHIFYTIYPIGMTSGVMCMITALYCVIHSHDQLDKFTLIFLSVVFLLVSFSLNFGFRLANRVTDESLNYADSFLKNTKDLSKFDQLYFGNYRPLGWKMGSFVTFSKSMVLVVMSDIVVDMVVTLLLSLED